MKKLIFGVGINDSDCAVNFKQGNRRVNCPIYQSWRDMMRRCYSELMQSKRPTYIGCSVCDEWKLFSNFKSWMENQDWRGKELDKDLLYVGNKVYSPQACVLVSSMTNGFTLDCRAAKGDWPLGVSFHKSHLKFGSRCQNPFTKRLEHLGYFACPSEAHEAWRKRKHELACQLAELQTDARVAEALRNRYKTTVQRQLTE